MKLYSFNIEKFPIFPQKKVFLVFLEMEYFSIQARKTHLEKDSYVLGNGNPEKSSHI